MPLQLEYNGKQIPIADIEIKSSNEQVTLGSLERNLILKTLGKISIQIGNKYFDLNIDTDKEGNSFINNIYTIKDHEALDPNNYENGSFVYGINNNGLYFIYNKKIIELSSGNKSKLFLSFAEEQDLNGVEIKRLVYNAKLRIEKFEEILKFTNDDVYEKQILFVEDQNQHYILNNYNYPNVLTSWIPLYLSTNGGTLFDGLTIYNKTKSYTLNLEGLHKEGNSVYNGLRIGTDLNFIKTAATEDNYIKTDINGKGIIINRNGKTIFEYDQGKIGIGGKSSRSDIDNIIYGTSKLTGNLFTNYNIMSDNFISRNITEWNGGKGYALKKTSIGTWFLEIDDLVVRNSISAEVLNLKELVSDRTYATGGHMMVTDGGMVTDIEYVENLTEESKNKLKHPLKETTLNGVLELGQSYYFVYFNKQDKNKDEETGESSYDTGAFCPFIKGDILLCQKFKGLKTKKYYLVAAYSDNYRIAINYKDFHGSYIIEDSDRVSTDFDIENNIAIGDELVRVGNEDPKRISRQKVIDINGMKNWITMYDNLNSLKYAKDEDNNFVYDNDGRKIVIDGPLTYENLKLRIGDLAGLPDLSSGYTNVLPENVGYGLYAENVYLKGKLVLWRKEDGVEYLEDLGINRGEWNIIEKYYLGDKVTYNGSYFYCKSVERNDIEKPEDQLNYIIGLNPDDYTDNWLLLVKRGADGKPGDSVNYINITGLSYFKINSSKDPDPKSISLTANLHNVEIDPLLKTIRYQWICNTTVIKDITYSESFENHLKDNLNILYNGKTSNLVGVDIKEIDWTLLWKDVNYNTFICNVFINENTSSEDQFTIYKIQDGEEGKQGDSAFSFILSNESLSIPASFNGYIPTNFIGINSKSLINLKVFKGTKELIYDENNNEDTFNYILEGEEISFFQKINNNFFLIKGNYIDNDSPIIPDGFIITLKIKINDIIYDKKVSYSLSKAGQDANLVDWIKEWSGNSTEISSDGIISPKLYIGNKISKIDGKYIITDGIYLGRGLNEGDASSFIGYKDGSRMFELTSDGRFFLGKQKTEASSTTIPIYTNGGLSFDGDKLIIGNDTSVGNESKTLGDYITTIDNYGEQITKIVGDKYITASEKFNLKEIVTRIEQEYKDVETSLSGLLNISNIETLPSLSPTFNLYKKAYNNFNSVLFYYINSIPDSSGFIVIIPDQDLVNSNITYYSTLTSVKLDIENLRKNKFETNTTNVFRQEEQPITRPGGDPLQIGDIWIKINSLDQELFSEIVISVLNNIATWKFLGDNTGTTIDQGLISTGTIKLMDKNSLIDKAGITGSNAIGLFFNPLDLSDVSLTSDTIHSEQSFIRFWAGLKDVNKNWNDAPFKVYENGTLFASAGKIGCLSINGENFNVGGLSTYSTIDTGNKEASLIRIKPGLTIDTEGNLIGQDFFLSGNTSKKSSIFIGKVYFIENGKLESAEDKINRLNLSLNEMFSLVMVNNDTGEVLDKTEEIPGNYSIAIRANFGLFTNSFLSAKGMSKGSGSGSSVIKNVYGYSELNKIYDDSILTNTFNAYTINKLNERIISLENGEALSSVTVKLGDIAYNSVNGVVSLPAYPITDLSNYVTLNTAQTITGIKMFYNTSFTKTDLQTSPRSQPVVINGINNDDSNGYLPAIGFYIPDVTYANLVLNRDARFGFMNYTMTGYLEVIANSFIKDGGTINQLLRADGGLFNIEYSGLGGQPTWLWGTNTGDNTYVWNPSNFNVNSATFLSCSFNVNNPADAFFISKGINHWASWTSSDNAGKINGGGYNVGISVGGVDTTKYGFQLGFSSSYDSDIYCQTFTLNIAHGWNRILHSGNWSSIVDGRYLPLTGGTVTGTITCNGYFSSYGWFQNNVSGTGLYSAPNDARWYAEGGQWISDKPIYTTRGITAGDFTTPDWFRTTGNTGWYSQKWGGGWYMEDGAYIRVYGGKKVHCNNETYECFNASGGYYSNWDTSHADTWTNALEPSFAAFSRPITTVGGVTINNVVGWGDVISGIGYMTRYSIASKRDSSGWGAMQLSVGNSDAGDSGYYLALSGYGEMRWTGNILADGRVTAADFCTGNDGWYRSVGQVGWYNETYGGGIHMTNDTWVTVYNSKRLLVGNVIRASSGTGTGCNGFQVSGQFFTGIEMYCADNTFGIGVDPNDNAYMWATYSGNIDSSAGKKYLCDIGIYSGQMNWYGVIHATVGMYSDGYMSGKGQNTSDIRLKTDIQDFNATDIIKQLQPKSYYWNNEAHNNNAMFSYNKQYGLIAQESDNIIDDFVVTDMFNDGYYGIRYDKLIPILLKAQLENIDKVEDIEIRVNRLEKENIKLKQQLKELKNVE